MTFDDLARCERGFQNAHHGRLHFEHRAHIHDFGKSRHIRPRHQFADFSGLESAPEISSPGAAGTQASSCVPAAPGLEIAGADFKADEIRELMSWPDVAGLAEVMDMRAVLEMQPRMMDILEAANASGKIIEGHARELTGPGLMAYLSAGISADHEIGSGADALEKLRAGFTVEIRARTTMCCRAGPGFEYAAGDPDQPDRMHRRRVPGLSGANGGINDVLRRLIRYGLEPLQAIRCATINNAIRLRRDDLGLVAAGRRADLVALSDLRK